MKHYSIVLIALSSLLLFCFPSLASNIQEQEEILSATRFSAEELKDVVPCDARANPLLYYIPVEEMQCEVPVGYGIDFEGTLEREVKAVLPRAWERLSLLSIPFG